MLFRTNQITSQDHPLQKCLKGFKGHKEVHKYEKCNIGYKSEKLIGEMFSSQLCTLKKIKINTT